jgi:hypothetical protein
MGSLVLRSSFETALEDKSYDSYGSMVFCWVRSSHQAVQFEFSGQCQASVFCIQIEPAAAYDQAILPPRIKPIITVAASNCSIKTIQ